MMRQLAHHPMPRAAEPIRGAVAAEAVEIYRTLITVEPAGFISMLRSVLRLQVAVLPALGRVRAGMTGRWVRTFRVAGSDGLTVLPLWPYLSGLSMTSWSPRPRTECPRMKVMLESVVTKRLGAVPAAA